MEEAVIPDHIDGQRVVAIADDVFSDIYHLEQVTIPASVRSIGVRAFKNCGNLEQITLPAELQSLGGEAFMNCTSLREIQIPEGVTELRGNTFEGCSNLESVELPEGMTAIHAYCFRGCTSLSSIQLPAHISEIRTYTFEGCSDLTHIEIPVGVTRIASHAFHNCTDLSYVYLPDTLEEIGSSAFRNCTSLKFVEMPQGVTREDNSFKESPTKIKDKHYTDLEWLICWQDAKSLGAPMYYMYNLDKGIDAICRYGTNGYVVLSDNPGFADLIDDTRDIQPLETEQTLIDWLEKAKSKDVPSVMFYHYSQAVTDDQGDPTFVALEYSIDVFLELLTMGE